jgi:hypothetical protein
MLRLVDDTKTKTTDVPPSDSSRNTRCSMKAPCRDAL